MNNETIELTLVPSIHDAKLESNAYQEELRDFLKQLSNSQVRPVMFAQDGLDGLGGLAGIFLLYIASDIMDVIKAACLSYLNRDTNRRVRAKGKDFEFESNVKDLNKVVEAIAKLTSKTE